MQYFPIYLLVYIKSRAFPNELNILHLGRYCIPFVVRTREDPSKTIFGRLQADER